MSKISKTGFVLREKRSRHMLPGRHTIRASVPPPALHHNPRPNKEIAESSLKLELVPGQTARLCTPIMQINAKAGAAHSRKRGRGKEKRKAKAKKKGNVGRLREVMENLPLVQKAHPVVHPRVVPKMLSHASTT